MTSIMPESKNELQDVSPAYQLSAYDDLLTDALVDRVRHWMSVSKNRRTYSSPKIRGETILQIIQEEIVANKDLDTAERRLLATDGIRQFENGLRTDKEKANFRRHTRRYAQIYLPDCSWEINATNRYTIVNLEAAITARRCIRRNEPIKYLSGIQVAITPEEEEEISFNKKDFSIAVSSRNKRTSLLLGPARFANHDCDANAKLVATGRAISIFATQDINVGDEITVTYGKDYFGEGNRECLCQSCETALRNGWVPDETATSMYASIEQQPERYSLRSRCARENSPGEDFRNTPSLFSLRPRGPKHRPGRLSMSSFAVATSTPRVTPGGQKHPNDTPAPISAGVAKRTKNFISASPVAMRSRFLPRHGLHSVGKAARTDVRESPPPRVTTLTNELDSYKEPCNLTLLATETMLDTSTDNEMPSAGADISIGTTEVLDEPKKVQNGRAYQHQAIIKEKAHEARRTPRDHLLAPLSPEMVCISCCNCATYFVQKEYSYTRSSCPRCESHYIIYGYTWPETCKTSQKSI